MQQMLSPTLQDATFRLIALLERHSDQLPLLDEELNRHRSIAQALVDQTRKAEVTLNAWRNALAQRWRFEVEAQRVFSTVLRDLSLYYGSDPAYALIIAPVRSSSAITPIELLCDVRRLEAAIDLLAPRPPFADDCTQRLRDAAERLADAIDQTEQREAERRNVVAEQRLVNQLLQRAYERTHSLLMRHLTTVDLSILPPPPEIEKAA
ncbi:hypothetical protein [Candidatus Viridilinea mediisalina]|uniref:Uncharacterized protein n=1 Tax=Candidatus Viridilinea mediisalina TaxID=2024553 RepID=A0A2A6RFI0_9CHLR|nr:hypothetical protein [Candidatus Viridilinea mediisalina]PDW01638.1 hypothetical protein CJ255_18050 [Candidatus Viridilinea mediisalina]